MVTQSIEQVRAACRALLRRPSFSATAVGILTIGLAASVAVGSLARSILLDALPYPDGDRLVSLYEANDAGGMPEVLTSYRNFLEWRDLESFEALAIARGRVRVVLTAGDGAQTLEASVVSPELFEITGARAVVGRLFGDEVSGGAGKHPVIVLSQELWRGRFGEDPAIVGRSVGINGRPYEVVGVMEAGFVSFPEPRNRADAWMPVVMAPELIHPDVLENRTIRQLPVLGKLQHGVTVEQARAELAALSERLATEHPQSNEGWVTRFQPVRELYLGTLEGPVVALLVGAGFLLLIGCANVANLLLVRASERGREVALRRALGASRRRIGAQMMTEAVVLTLVAGGLGAILATLAVGTLASVSPVPLPPFVEPRVDGAMLAVAMGASILTGLAFGMVPLVGGAGGDLKGALASGGGRSVGQKRDARLRRGFVVLEVATALTLLAGSGLAVRSFQALKSDDKGFDPEGLLTLSVEVSTETHDDEELPVLAEDLMEAARSVAGIASASIWSPHVPGAATWYTRVRPLDRPEATDDELPLVRFHYVSGGAFADLGLRLIAGRGIEERDRADSRTVVVLSAGAAEHLWPGQNAVGSTLRRWNRDAWATVVGVVADAKQGGRQGPGGEFARDVYFSFAQEPQRAITLVAAAVGTPEAATASLRDRVQNALPGLPVFDIQPLAVRLGEEEKTPRFTAILAVWYAAIALALAGIGLYGVLAYAVSKRTREIGLRLALGAVPAMIRITVVREGVVLALEGVALGLVLTLGLARLLDSILYGIQPTDPVALGLAPLFVILVVVAACALPARRATRVDPMVALRNE